MCCHALPFHVCICRIFHKYVHDFAVLCFILVLQIHVLYLPILFCVVSLVIEKSDISNIFISNISPNQRFSSVCHVELYKLANKPPEATVGPVEAWTGLNIKPGFEWMIYTVSNNNNPSKDMLLIKDMTCAPQAGQLRWYRSGRLLHPTNCSPRCKRWWRKSLQGTLLPHWWCGWNARSHGESGSLPSSDQRPG